MKSCSTGHFAADEYQSYTFPNYSGFSEMYRRTDITISPILNVNEHMADEALKARPELSCKETKIADFFMLGVHSDYRGNKIANHLMRGKFHISNTLIC